MNLINHWEKAIKGFLPDKKLTEIQTNGYFPPLTSVTFTRQCIMNCKHCVYPQANNSDICLNNLKRIDKIIGATYRAGVRDLIHVGRILKKEHLPILKKYQDKGMTINLIDNGSAHKLIPEIKKRGLYFNGGIDISIDGDRASHEVQRGANTYETAINGARALQAVASHISVTGTASPLNYDSIIKGLGGLEKKLPFVKKIHITTVSPANFQKPKMSLSPSQMRRIFSDAVKASKSRNKLYLSIFRTEDIKAVINELRKYKEPERKYISLEWKINNLTVSYFPVSLVCTEEFAIDANGAYVLPFGLDHHLSGRPEKWEIKGDLILHDPDKAYGLLVKKYFNNLGQAALREEKNIFKNIL